MLTQRLRFSGLNRDAAPHDLQPGDYVSADNLRLYNPLTQASGEAEALAGHRPLLTAAMPDTGQNEVVGTVEAEHLGAVFYFVHNSLGRHSICRLDHGPRTASLVLEWPGLNLSPDALITGAAVVEQTLFWTDFRNEPRKLNLARLAAEPALYAALKAGEPHFLDLMRPGPQYALVASRERDPARPGRSQLPADVGMQFSYLFVYNDGERSVLAPWSNLLHAPASPFEQELNVVRLRRPAGAPALSLQVARVELVLRPDASGPAGVVQVLDAALLRAAGAVISFAGETAGTGLDPALAVKPFDYVPQRSRALDYLDNRLFLGGNEEGYAAGPAGALTALALTSAPVVGGPAPPLVQNRALFRRSVRDAFNNAATVNFWSADLGADNVDPNGLLMDTGLLHPDPIESFWICLSGVEGQPGSVYGRLSNLTGIQELVANEPVDGVPPATSHSLGVRDVTTADYLPSTLPANRRLYADFFFTGPYVPVGQSVGQPNRERRLELVDGALVRLFAAEAPADPGAPALPSQAPVVSEGPGSAPLIRRVFKGGSRYDAGVVYFDWAGRTPGVAGPPRSVTIPGWEPGRRSAPATFADRLAWTLDPAQAAAIPVWAHSYALARTRNLSTSYFVQGQGLLRFARRYEPLPPGAVVPPPVEMIGGAHPAAPHYGPYVTTDEVPLNPVNGPAPVVIPFFGVLRAEALLLDLGALLLRGGAGYAFNPGDRCRLSYANPLAVAFPQLPARYEFDLLITGMAADKLLLPLPARLLVAETELAGRGRLTYEEVLALADEVSYEIYTPYVRGEQEPYFEASPRYAITQPGTVRRQWSQVGGELFGDVWTQAVRWFGAGTYAFMKYVGAGTNKGPDFELDARRTSTVLVETMNPAPDQGARWAVDLGRVTAEVRGARTEDKFAAVRFSNPFVQGTQTNGLSSFEPLNEQAFPRQDGPIRSLQGVRNVLLVMQELDTQSAYIGASQLQDIQGKSLISISDRIIGSHRPLDGGYGCQHPETVRRLGSYVYWWDCRRGVVLRYANDGVTEISAYGLVGYFAARRAARLSADPRPRAWCDNLHREYVLRIGAGPAVAFCEPLNRWTAFYSAAPDYASPAGMGVVSFKGSAAYFHDDDPTRPGRQLGIDYPVRLELATVLGQAKVTKVWQTIALEGSAGWHAPLITTHETLATAAQNSRLAPFDFEQLEGQHYAAFLRDERTPCDNPLEEGDELRSTLLLVRLEHHTPVTPAVAAAPARLRAVTIGATPSSPY